MLFETSWHFTSISSYLLLETRTTYSLVLRVLDVLDSHTNNSTLYPDDTCNYCNDFLIRNASHTSDELHPLPIFSRLFGVTASPQMIMTV